MLIWSVLWCGLDGRNGHLLLGLVSPGSWLLLFIGSRGRDRRKNVARIAREGSRASHPGLPVHVLFLATLQDC